MKNVHNSKRIETRGRKPKKLTIDEEALKKCTNRQGWGGSNSLIRYTNAMDRKQHWLKLFR